MRAFDLLAPAALDGAIAAGAEGAQFIAGGTDAVQLWQDGVEEPDRVVDLEGLIPGTIEAGPQGLRLGALARMNAVGEHPAVMRDYPVISQSLLLAASPQIRNMGTMGGNLLQRTRCHYFRDPGFAACNKRNPGSGCAAWNGHNRELAVLGGSTHCIATHPSDLPVALAALDAVVEVRGAGHAVRPIPITEFYRLPGGTPDLETILQPGDVILAITVPASAAARRSTYLKVRDRASFEFALVSAAVAMELRDGIVRDVRVAMGGVAPKPWRMRDVEAALIGKPPQDGNLRQAAALAAEGAQPRERNGFKPELMRRTVLRALKTVAA